MRVHIFVISVGVLFSPLLGQQRRPGDKPVLIRPGDEMQEEEVIVHDPKQAREHVTIGDFYFKRDNFKAAAERYRDAIRYHLQWDEPYRKLVEALTRQGEFEAAVEICLLYIENNPEGDKIKDFEEKSSKLLEEKIQKGGK